MICLNCSIEQFKSSKTVKCGICSQDTEVEPMMLETAFLQLPERQKIEQQTNEGQNECLVHKGCYKVLYCQEDQEQICIVCAQYLQKHRGHTIRDIQDVLNEIQESELKDIQRQTQKWKVLIDKKVQEAQINEQRLKNDKSLYYIYVDGGINQIITFLQNLKEKRTQEFQFDIQAYEQEMTKQSKFLADMSNEIAKLIQLDLRQPQQSLDFIQTGRKIQQNINLLENQQVKVIFEQNTQQIKNQLKNAFEYKIVKEQKKPQARIFKHYTIKHDSNQVITFNSETKKFAQQQSDIPKTQSNYTQIEQMNDTLIISGGGVNDRRFILFSEDSIQQMQMKNSRGYHRTVFDFNNQIYIISGYGYNEGWKSIKECEVFNQPKKQFKAIQDIQIDVFYFGACCDSQEVLVFGGYSMTHNYVDTIQIFKSVTNT